MKMIKSLLFFCLFGVLSATAQDMPTEGLPSATISATYTITLDDEAPLGEFYRVDISALTFANATEAEKAMRTFVSGNLISNQVHYAENFMVIRIHTEFLSAGQGRAEVQNYLDSKGRSIE